MCFTGMLTCLLHGNCILLFYFSEIYPFFENVKFARICLTCFVFHCYLLGLTSNIWITRVSILLYWNVMTASYPWHPSGIM
jgi:hypothetical protein